MFEVGEVLVIGILGYVLLRLGFHPAPILLGFVLGPRFEENFRRAMLISRGDLAVFVERPISAVFIALCVILIGGQIYFRLQRRQGSPVGAALEQPRRRTASRADGPSRRRRRQSRGSCLPAPAGSPRCVCAARSCWLWWCLGLAARRDRCAACIAPGNRRASTQRAEADPDAAAAMT